MFDVYSQLRSDARILAFSKPETPPTWPEMIRQSRGDDVEARLFKAFFDSPLFSFAVGPLPHFLRWPLNPWSRPDKRVRVHRHYLPLKHHAPVHR